MLWLAFQTVQIIAPDKYKTGIGKPPFIVSI